MSNLAIIIPAYKIDFFRHTLDSLKNQTCKDFTVYIGDDCSPCDFASLVDEYKDSISIVYQKFYTNLGGKDLVAQWNRCLDMSKEEPWLWLFSDDDVMGSRCVELFYKTLEDRTSEKHDLYHFDVEIINELNHVIRHSQPFPVLISSLAFYKAKSSARLDCFVVEYVFSRNIYNKVGGFENFELAWGSDIATWIKMGAENGMKTIPGDFVYWRKSDRNITPDLNNAMVYRKLNIDMDCLNWANNYFGKNKIEYYNKYILFRLFFYYSMYLTKVQINSIMQKAVYLNIISYSFSIMLIVLFPVVKKVKIIKSILKL